MSSIVEFELTIDKTGNIPAEARLELDVSGDDQISNDEAVKLVADGTGKRWVGRKKVEQIDGTLFYLRMIAPKGARWVLKATADGKTVLNKSGTMKTTKIQAVGRLEVKS